MTPTLFVFSNEQLQNFSLRMGLQLELVIIFVLIVVFIISFCGLLQKIRRNYEETRERAAAITEIYVTNPAMGYRNPANDTSLDDLQSSGVFPSSPPPYTEHGEPPPKYDDVIKETNIVLPAVHTSNIATLSTTQTSITH